MNGTYYTVEYRNGNDTFVYYTNTDYYKARDFFFTCNGYDNNLVIIVHHD